MTPEELLDATLAKARKVPIGGEVDPDEVAREAIESARIEARVRRARRGRFLAGAAAAVAVLTIAWGTWSALRAWTDGDRAGGAIAERPAAPQREGDPSNGTIADGEEAPRPSAGEPRRLRLASGDVLVGSPDVAFDVLSEQRDRVIHLGGGDMLFDVVHEPQGSFVVRTGDFSIVVLGTVFSVRREGHAIGVRVFEGSVLVRGADGDELQRLGTGELWVSGPLQGMEQWGIRGEREWRRVVLEGGRAERRAPAVAAATESPDDDAAPEVTEGDEEEPSDPLLTRGRERLAGGDFGAVLRLSEEHPAEGPWLLLRADALRGLGRNDAAARAYEAAARVLRDDRRTQAAFAAAQLRAETSPESALALLARFGVTRPSSALEERARALRIRLLRGLGRDDEADAEELAHEERFGAGGDRPADPPPR